MPSEPVSWQVVALALIAALPGLIAAVAAFRTRQVVDQRADASEKAVGVVHDLVNSRLTELLRLVGESQRAEGKLEGLAQQPPPVLVAPAVAAGAPGSPVIHSGDAVTVVKDPQI